MYILDFIKSLFLSQSADTGDSFINVPRTRAKKLQKTNKHLSTNQNPKFRSALVHVLISVLMDGNSPVYSFTLIKSKMFIKYNLQ